jgi:transposase, IS6 family
MNNQNPFKWRHYEADIILLCVRWYLRYSLS